MELTLFLVWFWAGMGCVVFSSVACIASNVNVITVNKKSRFCVRAWEHGCSSKGLEHSSPIFCTGWTGPEASVFLNVRWIRDDMLHIMEAAEWLPSPVFCGNASQKGNSEARDFNSDDLFARHALLDLKFEEQAQYQ